MTACSVGNRIAVDLGSLDLPISAAESLDVLARKNIRQASFDIANAARELVGKARWKLSARQWEAPRFFDCSSLTKWLYGQKGVWIPRRPLQQLEFCRKFGSIRLMREIVTGDLIFLSSPYKNGLASDSEKEIGHVCIASGDGNAVCATNSELGTGVVELPIDRILSTRKLGAIGRVLDRPSDITTLIFPPEREVETVDDIRWIVLQSL